MINILLAEDHNIVRNGISMLLQADEEINISGEAVNGREVLSMIEAGIQADLVMADINMPEMDGITLIQQLKLSKPDIRIVVLSMLDNEKYVNNAFSEGADGYLLKNVSADELIFSLKHVHAGNKYLCSELAIRYLDRLMKEESLPFDRNHVRINFSERELEILRLICDGLTNYEMSEKLYISRRTIEGHRQTLIEKTNSKNTAALVKFAALGGYLQP